MRTGTRLVTPSGLRVVLAIATIQLPAVALGQAADEAAGTKASDPESKELMRIKDEKTVESVLKTEREIDSGREFQGISFGVGLAIFVPRALSMNSLSKHEQVEEAELAGDPESSVVRVSKKRGPSPRVVLESHYFVTCENLGFEAKNCRWGVGPFVALQSGEDVLMPALGFGLMGGFRRRGESKSFNIGVGLAVEPKQRVLAGDLQMDQPLPPDETKIRYIEKTLLSWMIVGSFGF